MYEFGLPSPFHPDVIAENRPNLAYFHSEKMTFFAMFGAFLRENGGLLRKTEPIAVQSGGRTVCIPI